MKNKIKVFIALGITLITTLIFTISTLATPGYEVNQNGNIESLNLFSYFNSWSNGSNTDTKNYFNLRISFNDQSILVVNESYETNGLKNVSFTTPNSLNNMLIKHNGSSRDIDILYTTDLSMLQPNSTYTFSFNLVGYNPSVNNGLSFNNIMLNAGSSALDYFPYGNYTNDNQLYGSNGFYNNVKSITYMDQGTTQIELDTITAYKYLSNATLNLEDLLTANGITNTQQRQTRRQLLEIILNKPINLSNFIYYLQFDGDPKGTPPEDYYISFFNDNPNITGSNDSSIFYFEDTEYINNVGYKLELKGSMFINEIDIYWENLESDRCWPYRMTSSEYNIGLETGKNQGYATGYNNGINQGTQQGIKQGIQQADSRINTRIVHHI